MSLFLGVGLLYITPLKGWTNWYKWWFHPPGSCVAWGGQRRFWMLPDHALWNVPNALSLRIQICPKKGSKTIYSDSFRMGCWDHLFLFDRAWGLDSYRVYCCFGGSQQKKICWELKDVWPYGENKVVTTFTTSGEWIFISHLWKMTTSFAKNISLGRDICCYASSQEGIQICVDNRTISQRRLKSCNFVGVVTIATTRSRM